jgi:hypothetical protein
MPILRDWAVVDILVPVLDAFGSEPPFLQTVTSTRANRIGRVGPKIHDVDCELGKSKI